MKSPKIPLLWVFRWSAARVRCCAAAAWCEQDASTLERRRLLRLPTCKVSVAMLNYPALLGPQPYRAASPNRRSRGLLRLDGPHVDVSTCWYIES